MSRASVAALAVTLALCGCPERATPQRGIALTFKKPEGAFDLRAVVDRRLAQLSLKATLQEDAHMLTVRVPEGGDVAAIKQLLLRRGRLGFCAVDEEATRRWCDAPTPGEAALASPLEGCAAPRPAERSHSAGPVDAGPGPGKGPVDDPLDAGVRVVLEKKGPGAVAWPVDGRCLEPTLVAATAQPPAPGAGRALQLQFDRRGTADFAALTGRLVGQRLLIVLDDEVLVAPLVESAITAGKAMLVVDESELGARVLAAALAGGSLPALELLSEKPYGPPSLR